ncbi:FKBP-type peptidyl-prolyl isomerase-like protein [Streptomyces sp. 846.5]|nr:FKBP-type peptidyl-prolyl cis-trans isomerase [Streptomyces sp. 846.5]TDU02875.1 FKBP-type peptidyl-prolyl isomerase-like protein [Streptomyces sp. 846.5]
MRRTATAAALLLVPALLLTACSSGSKSKSADATTPTASASASASAKAVPVPAVVDTTVGLPTVGGTFGKDITLTLPSGTPTDKFVVHTVTEGTGATATTANFAIFNFTVEDWTTGKTLNTAYGKTSAPAVRKPTDTMIPALDKAVVGHKVGSRVVVVAPPGAASAQMASSEPTGVTAKDTLVFVIDINQVVGAKDDVTGTQVASPAGMPTVVATAGKAATFTIPDAAKKPAKLETGVLIKGAGAKVLSGQTIIVQYTGATLADGKVFDSSWKDNGAMATVIGQQQVITGWDQGLVGQTVGSRVLLSIPSKLAYGASPPANSGIAANADMVFVVDILAAA